ITETAMCHTLVHELTHDCLAHLPLPPWLNEGVAQTIERMLTWKREPVLHQELADQHRNYWTEENIQEFWAGTSFHQPGDPQTLSYSLAEIIVQLLTSQKGDFKEFLRRATYVDAGQTAALDCFGCSLGNVLTTFLGPGEWRPVRKALVEAWNRQSSEATEATEEGNPS